MKPPKGEPPAEYQRSPRGVKRPAKYSDFVVFPTPKRQPRSESLPPIDRSGRTTTPAKSGNPKKDDATPKGAKSLVTSPQKNPRSRYDKFQSSKGTKADPPSVKPSKAKEVPVSSNIRNRGRASLPSTLEHKKNEKTAENGSAGPGPKKFMCKRCGFVGKSSSEITRHFNQAHLGLNPMRKKSRSTVPHDLPESTEKNGQKMDKHADTALETVLSQRSRQTQLSSRSKSDASEDSKVPVSANLRNSPKPRSLSKKQNGLEKRSENGKTTQAQVPAPAHKRQRTSGSAQTASRGSETDDDECSPPLAEWSKMLPEGLGIITASDEDSCDSSILSLRIDESDLQIRDESPPMVPSSGRTIITASDGYERDQSLSSGSALLFRQIDESDPLVNGRSPSMYQVFPEEIDSITASDDDSLDSSILSQMIDQSGLLVNDVSLSVALVSLRGLDTSTDKGDIECCDSKDSLPLSPWINELDLTINARSSYTTSSLKPGQKPTEGMAQSKSSKHCSLDDCRQLCLPSLGVSVHRFPMPGNPMRKHWLTLTKKTCNKGTLYICSRHFTHDDYNFDDKKDPSDRFYRQLKGSAIPTVHVPVGSKVIDQVRSEIAESGLGKSMSRTGRKQQMSPSRNSKETAKEQEIKLERSTTPKLRGWKSTSLSPDNSRGRVKAKRDESLKKDPTSKECSLTPTPCGERGRSSSVCSDGKQEEIKESKESGENTTSQDSYPDPLHLEDRVAKREEEVNQETNASPTKKEDPTGKTKPSEVLKKSEPKEINGLEHKDEKLRHNVKKPDGDAKVKGSSAKIPQESKAKNKKPNNEVNGKTNHKNDISKNGMKIQKEKNGLVNGKKEMKQQQKTANQPKKVIQRKRKSVQSLENGHAVQPVEKAGEQPAEIIEDDAFDGVERQVEFISIDFNRRIMLELQIQSRLKELQRQNEESVIEDNQNGNESITRSSSIDSIRNIQIMNPSIEITIDNGGEVTEECGSQKMAKHKKHRKENIIDTSKELSPVKMSSKKKKTKRALDAEYGDVELVKPKNEGVDKLDKKGEQVESTFVRRSLRERKVRYQLTEKVDNSIGGGSDESSDEGEEFGGNTIADNGDNEGLEVAGGEICIEENLVRTALDEPDCKEEPIDGKCEDEEVNENDENECRLTPRKAIDRRNTRGSAKVTSSPSSRSQHKTPTKKISSSSPQTKHSPKTPCGKTDSHSPQSNVSPKSLNTKEKTSITHQSNRSPKTPESKLASPLSPRANPSKTLLKEKDSPNSAEKGKAARMALDVHSKNPEVEASESFAGDSTSPDGNLSDANGCSDSEPEGSINGGAQTGETAKDTLEDHPVTPMPDETSRDGESSAENEDAGQGKHIKDSAENAIYDDLENSNTKSPSKNELQSPRGKKRKYPYQDELCKLKECKVVVKRLTLAASMMDRLQSVKFFLIKRNTPQLLPNPKAQAAQPPPKPQLPTVDLLTPTPVTGPITAVKKFVCKRCGFAGKMAAEITKHFNTVHLGLEPKSIGRRPALLPSSNGARGVDVPPEPTETNGQRLLQTATKTSGPKIAKTEDYSSDSVLSVGSSSSDSDDVEDNGVSCGLCGYRTDSLADLREHSKYHTGAGFYCTICGFKSEIEDDFNAHLRNSHTDVPNPDSKPEKLTLKEEYGSTSRGDGIAFLCRPCNFRTYKSNDYSRHLGSSRHRDTLKSAKTSAEVITDRPVLSSIIKSEADPLRSYSRNQDSLNAASIKVEINFNCTPRDSSIGPPENALPSSRGLSCAPCSYYTHSRFKMDRHVASIEHLNKIEIISKIKTQANSRDDHCGGRPEDRRFYCEPCDVLLRDGNGYTRHCSSLKHKSIVGDKDSKPVITYVDPNKGTIKPIKSEPSRSAGSVRRPVTPTLSSQREKRNRKPLVVSDNENDAISNNDGDDTDDDSDSGSDAAVDSDSDEDYNPAWEEAKLRWKNTRRRSLRSSMGDRDKKESSSELPKLVESKLSPVKLEPKLVHSSIGGQIRAAKTIRVPDVILQSRDAGFLKLTPEVRSGLTADAPRTSPQKSPVGNIASHPVLKQISIITKSEGNQKSLDKTHTCATCGYQTTFTNSFNRHLHWRGHEAVPEPEPEKVEATPKTIKTESVEDSSTQEPSLVPNPKALEHEPDHKKSPNGSSAHNPKRKSYNDGKSASSTHRPNSSLALNPKRARSSVSEESVKKNETIPEENSNDMYHLKLIATAVLPENSEQSSAAEADIPIGCLFCDFKCATVSGLASHMKQHVSGIL